MKSFAIRVRGVKFPKMSQNISGSIILNILIFEMLVCHRNFHYNDVIRICVNVSEPTYVTYQQLEVSL